MTSQSDPSSPKQNILHGNGFPPSRRGGLFGGAALPVLGALATLLATSLPSRGAVTVLYFDPNNAVAESGVVDNASPTYVWDTSNANSARIWTDVPAGAGGPSDVNSWTNGIKAVFSASTDAADNTYTINANVAITFNALQVEEGAVTIGLAAGGSLALAATNTIIDVAPATSSPLNLSSLKITAAIGGGTNGIEKTNGGVLTLSGTNTYTGVTKITGGTLLMGANNVLANTSGVTLSGGKLATGGFSDTAGAFSLTATSVIDMGASNSILTLQSIASWDLSKKLEIWNWTGAVNTAGLTDQLIFLNHSGFTNFNASQVQFFSGAGGSTQVGSGAKFIGNELVAVPEASTVAGIAVLVGLVGWRERKYFLRHREVPVGTPS